MGRLPFLVAASAALLAIGCKPAIGDSCSNTTDCSVDAERICDVSQPGGYCTVKGCDPGTCPSGALCVEWRGEPPRTAETWCMKKCGSDDGCRQDDGYRCVHMGDEVLQDEDGDPIATIIDLDVQKRKKGFCAAVGAASP